MHRVLRSPPRPLSRFSGEGRAFPENRLRDRVAHGGRPDELLVPTGDVGRAQAGGQDPIDGRLDGVGRLGRVERMPQQQRGREDLGDRIGDVLAGGEAAAQVLVRSAGQIGNRSSP